MNEKQKLTKMYMPFYAACALTCLGFILFLFSFSSPYWLESYSFVHSEFLHMGIWSICFNKFIHPQDYHANELTGCYWCYDRFFFRIGIWEWLNPYWLIAIQVLIVIAFITELCAIIVLLLYYLLYGQAAAESTIALGMQTFVAILLTISVFVFGIKSEDRQWMQRPDHNFLSWSYGFLILATMCFYLSSGFLYCVSYTDRATQKEVAFYEATEGRYGMRSNTRYSHISDRKSTILTRSFYVAESPVVLNVPSNDGRPSQVVQLGHYPPPYEEYAAMTIPLPPVIENQAGEMSIISNSYLGSGYGLTLPASSLLSSQRPLPPTGRAVGRGGRQYPDSRQFTNINTPRHIF